MRSMGLPLLLLTAAVFTSAPASAEVLSPVTRVVQLLKGLSEKVEEEGKAEEDLYEKFVCWAKTIIDSKTASNLAARSRMDSLNTYISDLESGRIELTSERVDLEKEIEELRADLEASQSLRDKEEGDFSDAKDEMEKAIQALESAISVLSEATAGHEEGVLLGVRSKNNEALSLAFAARTAEAAQLHQAVELGEKFLTKGDALFLRRLLTGDVPDVDWKKLNRKATFKMSYKARSFKIQDVLAKLLQTFQTNLEEATTKEGASVSEHNTLKGSKETQKGAAEEALVKMAGENGASGQSKADSQAEVDMLTTQVENDVKYIGQVTQELTDKKEEWKDRQVLRTGELEAIGKAISILHSDDNRDLFKRSFESQKSFLQEAVSSSSNGRAADALRDAAHRSHDARMMKLAALVAVGGHFDEVINAVDAMVSVLKEEEQTDLANKESCESTRASDARDAIEYSRDIDELTDTVTKLQAVIAELARDITDKTADLAAITKEFNEATTLREEEKAEFVKTDQDDKDAAIVVQSAIDVMSEFYTKNQLMLTQKGAMKQPSAPAGKAPPPPPATWENPSYGGKTEESSGIIAIMGMVKEDIEKDTAKAQAEEDKAQGAWEAARDEFDTASSGLNNMITTLGGTKGEKEGLVVEAKESRQGKKRELNVVIKKIQDAESGCDYMTINYDLKRTNRQIEIDGLIKAKAILEGAAFAAPNEGREMKPGDALIQRQLRGQQ